MPDTAKVRELTGWMPTRDLNAVVKRMVGYAQDVGPETLLGR